jgi:hypothetical protein
VEVGNRDDPVTFSSKRERGERGTPGGRRRGTDINMRWAVVYMMLVAWVSGTLGAAPGPHAWVSPLAEAPAPTVGRPAAGERAAAGPLRLRGGGKKKETDKGAAAGKGKGKAAGGGDEDEEIGGLRPEPYEEPEGGRVDFHNVKLKQLADLKSGVLQPSDGLKALKRDRNIFPKVCAACKKKLRMHRILVAAAKHAVTADALQPGCIAPCRPLLL